MTVEGITVVRSVSELRRIRKAWRLQGLTVGLIPTMGFLHSGHQSLIRKSLQDNDKTVVSIFVNPSQFAPGEDLDSYPRNLEHDLEVLSSTHVSNGRRVSLVFAPTVSEMYPSGICLDVNEQEGAFVEVKGVSEQLEGKCRPAFFRGVATVVCKLFNIVQPERAYFGQKDVQQTVVVKRMVRDLFLDTEITIGPIERNSDGLALSSRNAYLSDAVKEKATVLYRSMTAAQKRYEQEGELDANKLIAQVENQITSENPQFKIDYVALNDPETLRYLADIDPKKGAILSMAVFVPNDLDNAKAGTTRLIDNCILPAKN